MRAADRGADARAVGADTLVPVPVAGSPADIPRRAALVTLGCARNEVDSEEFAGRLRRERLGSWSTPTVPGRTAGRRRGEHLRLRRGRPRRTPSTPCCCRGTAGHRREGGRRRLPGGALRRGAGGQHCPRPTRSSASTTTRSWRTAVGRARPAHARRRTCRSTARTLLPVTPVDRPAAARRMSGPSTRATHGRPAGSAPPRRGPVAALKIASGCDRRCTFCAIPSFRGSFVSRPIGRDRGRGARGWPSTGSASSCWSARTRRPTARTCRRPRALDRLLARLADVPGVDRVRLSYLQPAEIRPGLHRGDRRRAGGRATTSTCPSSTPARAGAAPDAPLRLDRAASSSWLGRIRRWPRRRASAAT